MVETLWVAVELDVGTGRNGAWTWQARDPARRLRIYENGKLPHFIVTSSPFRSMMVPLPLSRTYPEPTWSYVSQGIQEMTRSRKINNRRPLAGRY